MIHREVSHSCSRIGSVTKVKKTTKRTRPEVVKTKSLKSKRMRSTKTIKRSRVVFQSTMEMFIIDFIESTM